MTLDELKVEAEKLGYTLIKKSESIKMLPCTCGSKRRKEWKGDEVVAHCNLKENAELIAKILDADVNGEVWRGEEG